ncbi:hypothetical protein AVEN_236903-1 [Araneus ventricosus]|uniref:Uncharacterized protein n=1 Tax=Araneus ventricosus TaxID=182803 RepID=A0A4Y2DSQ9_ARAVE|nr:hypothetical protein AVEN_236903-1 [Araneus ventricosus]
MIQKRLSLIVTFLLRLEEDSYGFVSKQILCPGTIFQALSRLLLNLEAAVTPLGTGLFCPSLRTTSRDVCLWAKVTHFIRYRRHFVYDFHLSFNLGISTNDLNNSIFIPAISFGQSIDELLK